MSGSRRTLSSAHTFPYKFIFPVIWIIGFGFAALAVMSAPEGLHDRRPPSAGVRMFFAALWLIGTAVISSICMCLKFVTIENNWLCVSNFLKEVRVPLADVIEIRENRWLNIHPVTLTFSSETAFGRQIVFMPKMRWFSLGFSGHPVVDELKELVRQQGPLA